MKDPDSLPAACSLTSEEFRSREATLLERLRTAVLEVEELQNGYEFRFAGDGKWIELIAEVIVAERECCPFLTFEIEALPNLGPVIVRVTAPARAKDFVRTILYKSAAPGTE